MAVILSELQKYVKNNCQNDTLGCISIFLLVWHAICIYIGGTLFDILTHRHTLWGKV